MVTLNDVRKAAQSANKLGDIRSAIQDYLNTVKRIDNPIQWAVRNYRLLRQAMYPPATEYLDAQVKLAQADPTIKAEGQAQLQKYFDDCMAVKRLFPKTIEVGDEYRAEQ